MVNSCQICCISRSLFDNLIDYAGLLFIHVKQLKHWFSCCVVLEWEPVPPILLTLMQFGSKGFILGAEMATGGAAPERGTAAAAANLRRRRTGGGGGGAGGGTSGTMLQFYTDDAPGLKISPNVVLVMSIGFIAFVAVLHVAGKLYFVRKE
ncbi:hypothetical protein SASPL_106110 [Salvia splendens]|uniref:Protein transport protein Sec61 subunit beta n=2 Tax=Salvia splendens TaxID=180675 RepID=A0A8X9AAL5_SALSN|nr:hypothetical protein SASPL_106110 [Salvia splendens]